MNLFFNEIVNKSDVIYSLESKNFLWPYLLERNKKNNFLPYLLMRMLKHMENLIIREKVKTLHDLIH